MSGNVWEWLEDRWHSNYQEAPTDGTAWVDREKDAHSVLRGGSWSDAHRVFRGGSWGDTPQICRCTYRDIIDPLYRSRYYGFRLSLSLQAVRSHPVHLRYRSSG